MPGWKSLFPVDLADESRLSRREFARFMALVSAGFTGGMMLGYAAYMFVHHATHHFNIQPGDWLYESRLRHMTHHYREGVNYGVSTGFWDRAFGTLAMRRERAADA